MLSDVRVLDLTNYIAGPVCPRTLADLGADVIKIEEPGEEPPLWYPNLHIETHRGKRHIVLDLKEPRGRAIFLTLVATADVVVENAKAGVWERHGLGFEHLLAVQPNLIYASITAYGDDGPWGDWGGFEPNAQAATGLQVRFGGPDGPPRQAGGGAINDYGAPQLAAFAIVLALGANRRTPRPHRIASALAWSATLFQSADLLAMPGYCIEPLGGHLLRGPSMNSRLWPGLDGWIYAVLPGDTLGRFQEMLAPELDALDAETAERFAAITCTHRCHELLSIVERSGGYATLAPDTQQLKERLVEDGVYEFDNQPAWGVVGHIGGTVWSSPQLSGPCRPAPGWGEHTRAILSELGIAEAEIGGLYESWVVK